MENSVEEALERLSTDKKIKMYELLRTFSKEGIENFVITRKKYIDVILPDYKRVLKENEYMHNELDKQQITINKYAKENEELKADRDKFKKALAKRITYCNELEKDLFENCSNYIVSKQKNKRQTRRI